MPVLPGLSSNNLVLRAIHKHRLLAGIVLVHYLVAASASSALGQGSESELSDTFLNLLTGMVPQFIVAVIAWRFACMAFHVRPARPIPWLLADLRRMALDPDRLVNGVVALSLFLVLIRSFSLLKNLVPLEGASWDPVFAAIDRAIHGGHDPYTLLMPILGHPWVVSFINYCYHLWFPLFYVMTLAACFSKRSRDRDTFLIAFVLAWAIGGNLVAIAAASGGPAFYALLGHGDTFAPLMSALAESDKVSPVPSLMVQALLWEGQTGARPEMGISAMPSMHVTAAVVIALYGFRWSRLTGMLLSLFAGIIFVGSILLGWHYAIDGYVGALVATGCWALAVRLVGPAAERNPKPAHAKGPLWVGAPARLDLPPGE